MQEMTTEKTQVSDDVSFIDVLRLFLRKWKIFLIVLLSAIIVGASYGYLKTRNTNYFGTTIDFYVNPQKDENSDAESEYSIYGSYGENVMDNMVKLLSSELFAETLMLDKDGLPDSVMVEKIRAKKGDEVANALVVKIAEARASLDVIQEKQEAFDAAATVTANAKSHRDACWASLKTENADLGNDPVIIAKPQDRELTNAEKNSNEAIRAYNAAVESQKLAREALKNAKALKKPLFDSTLAQWRSDYSDYYAGELATHKNFIKYTYRSKTDDTTTSNFARSFFYVTITVNGKDAKWAEEFANHLRQRIIEYVPVFIEEIMPVPGGYLSTNCQRITRNDNIVNTNAGYALKTAIKYALILMAVALVVTCIVIVVIDRSDKRLRSVEQITDHFNLPVLGVIPTIRIDNDKNTTEENA